MLGWLKGRLHFAEQKSKHQAALAAGFHPLDLNQYRKYNAFRPGGKLPIFCYLPYNSMTFSMSGKVYVCAYNKNILLGTYPAQSITQIWNGQEAKLLRDHMRHNDLSYGCGHCKFYFDKGKFSNLRPPSFDKYSAFSEADYPRVLEFELSNECNLECQMCNGNVSSSIRKRRDGLPPMHNPYDDAFLEQLKPYLENIKEAKFYGGEPFLIPMYFRILQVIAAINPTCELFIITNGTHWSSKIEALTRDLNMDVAISIDSLQKPRLEKIRKNASFEKLIENIHRFNAIMRSKNRHLSLSFTIQQENWDELADFVRFCNSIEASVYVSYLDSPKHYAIAELSQEQLKQIHNELSSEILPTDTDLHCHNARCLADFISYVHRYITNQDEPQYDEYHESFLGRNHDSADFIMVDKEVSKEDLLQAFEQYLASGAKHKMFTALELFARLENVHNTFEPHHHALLRGMALQSDMTATFNSLTTQTAEELSTSLRKNLHRIRLR